MIIEGVQHNLNNFRIEGGGGTITEGLAPSQGAATVGSKGIWIRPPSFSGDSGGNITFLSNINIELHKPNSVGILIDKTSPQGSSGGSINKMSNIYNSSSDGMSRITVMDNNTVPGINPFDVDSLAVTRTSQSRKRYGSWAPGAQTRVNAEGLLRGNIDVRNNGQLNNATEMVTSAFANGPFATLATTATQYDAACILYNCPNGNRIAKSQNPTFYCRFLPNSTTGIRIFMGWWCIAAGAQFTAPTTGGATFDLLANKRGIGLYLDTVVSNNWKIMHNDGNASSTIVNFANKTFGNISYGPNAVNPVINAVTISYTDSNNSNPDVADGSTANVLHHGRGYDWKTTGVPSADNFGFLIYFEALTSGAKTLRIFDIEMGITVA
jgi:hypothetical protein